MSENLSLNGNSVATDKNKSESLKTVPKEYNQNSLACISEEPTQQQHQNITVNSNNQLKVIVKDNLNSNDENIPESEPLKYKFARVCLLICVAWTHFGSGFQWMWQSSTRIQTQIYYNGISDEKFLQLNELYLYIYVVTAPIGMYMVNKYFSLSIFLAAFSQALAAVLIYFSGNNYWLNFFSNTLGGLNQCWMFPSPSFMAQRYFSKKVFVFN